MGECTTYMTYYLDSRMVERGMGADFKEKPFYRICPSCKQKRLRLHYRATGMVWKCEDAKCGHERKARAGR